MCHLILIGCDKDESNLNLNIDESIEKFDLYDKSILNDVTVKDNVLYFSEGEIGVYQIYYLLQMENDEYYEFISKLSFTSLTSIYDALYDELLSIESKEDEESFLTANYRYFKLVGDRILPTKEISSYLRFINEDGIYMVGNRLHKIINESVVIAKNQSFNEELLSIINPNKIDESKFVSKVVMNRQEVIDMRSCSNFSVYKEYDGNRRVYLTAVINNIVSGDFTRKRILVEVWGEKKNIWGNWINYTTTLERRDSYFSLYNAQGSLVSYSINDHNSGPGALKISYNSDNDQFNVQQKIPCDYSSSSNCDWTLHFEGITSRAKSTGTNNNWARICCGSYSTCPPATGE